MKAIIFDCDGTLVDSEGICNEVLVESVAEHGLILSVDEALAAFRGGKMADCVSQLETRLGTPLPSDFVSVLRARMAEALKTRLRPVEGAVELVECLASLRYPISVASSGPVEKIELSLSVTGLLGFFTGRIVSCYEVGAWKPAPGVFLRAAQLMGVAAAECAVVEDSLPGVQAGLAAGMAVFALQPLAVDPRLPEGITILKSLRELRALVLGASSLAGSVQSEA